VLVVLLIGWSAYAVVSSDDDNPEAASDAPGGASSANRDVSDEASRSDDSRTGEDALTACASDVAVAENVVAVARTGVRHWHIHVQARTDMLAGLITDEVMKAKWKRTRLAGPADLVRFEAALLKYDEAPGCDGLDAVDDSSSDRAEDCAARSEATSTAVAAAQAAMGDWQAHQENMATFADGGMTAAHAQHEWVEAWRAAPANIEAYGDARAALAAAPECEVAEG
jgi:hypothetical protein